MYICERPEKMREPLADEFLGRERVTDAKGTRLSCDSAVERFENIVEGPSLWGDPKTLTPGPWSMDPPTDRVHGLPYGPVHGLSLRTPSTDHPKKHRIKYK